MSKPPPKGVVEHAVNTRTASVRTHHTRSVTATAPTNGPPSQRTPTGNPAAKILQGQTVTPLAAGISLPAKNSGQKSTPLHNIAISLVCIIRKEEIDNSTKIAIDGIIAYIQDEEENEKQRLLEVSAHVKESELRKNIKADLEEFYVALVGQLNGIQDTSNAILTSSDKLLKDTESVTAITMELTSKVGKITDTADKIATDTSKYRDAVISKPTQTNRSSMDPKVLGDMEQKARQILIDIFDKV